MQDRTFQRISETVRGGFAMPHRLSGIPGELSGCIYRRGRRQGRAFRAVRRICRRPYRNTKPRRPALPGTDRPNWPAAGLYLGHYMGGHYGHFITETLSTFWIFEEEPAEGFDYVLFHPFIFEHAIPDHVRFCFKQFGIREDQLVFAGDQPLAFDELVIPERLFRLNHSSDPRLRWVYRHVTQGARAPAGATEALSVAASLQPARSVPRSRQRGPHRNGVPAARLRGDLS